MRFIHKYKKYYSDIIQGALTTLIVYNLILWVISACLLLIIGAFPSYIVVFFECMTFLFFVVTASHFVFIYT